MLLRYEPLILLLGLVEVGAGCVAGEIRARAEAGSGLVLSRTPPFWPFGPGWRLLVVLVSGHRPVGNLLLVVVPLALLAGQGVERAWRWLDRRALWAEMRRRRRRGPGAGRLLLPLAVAATA